MKSRELSRENSDVVNYGKGVSSQRRPDELMKRFSELRKKTPKSEFLAKLSSDDLKRELEKR